MLYSLDYFGARYYRAELGRFTAVDPGQASAAVDDPQSWNAYAYARNNPLRYVDVRGLSYILCSRADQKLYVFDKDNSLKGVYDAANNVTSGSYELRDGVYAFKHTNGPFAPNPKGPDDDRFTEDGPLGPYGRFHLKDFWGADDKPHQYIALHSGRKSSGGYKAYTEGCIRTTDEAMAYIVDLAKDDPLTDLIVQNGSVLTVRPVVLSIRTSFVSVSGLLVPIITSVAISE
jgi:RHS repeat-associated protein